MQKVVRRREVPVTALLKCPDLHPLLARIYSSRGVQAPEELSQGLDALLPPESLLNATRAGGMLADAIAAQARILVIGDFDADGATSTALAVTTLRDFGATSVDYLVPNRFEYGYGLTPEIVALVVLREVVHVASSTQ